MAELARVDPQTKKDRQEYFGQGKRLSAMGGDSEYLQSETAIDMNKFLADQEGDRHALAVVGAHREAGMGWKPSVPVRIPESRYEL